MFAQPALETSAAEFGILRKLFERSARVQVVEALGDTRVVFVMGARQVGKSTLTSIIAEQDHPARILTLDDRATRAAALADPTGFVAGLDAAVVIDEVQRAPDLLLAIKEAVDRAAAAASPPAPGCCIVGVPQQQRQTGSIQVPRLLFDAYTGHAARAAALLGER